MGTQDRHEVSPALSVGSNSVRYFGSPCPFRDQGPGTGVNPDEEIFIKAKGQPMTPIQPRQRSFVGQKAQSGTTDQVRQGSSDGLRVSVMLCS
jgi:hypothetical protein